MGVVRTEEDDGDVLVRAVLARFFNILARKSGVRWIFGLYVLEIWLECVFFYYIPRTQVESVGCRSIEMKYCLTVYQPVNPISREALKSIECPIKDNYWLQ